MIGMHVWIEGADYFYDGSRTELVAAVVNNRIWKWNWNLLYDTHMIGEQVRIEGADHFYGGSFNGGSRKKLAAAVVNWARAFK